MRQELAVGKARILIGALTLVVVLAVLASGCGGDDGNGGDATAADPSTSSEGSAGGGVSVAEAEQTVAAAEEGATKYEGPDEAVKPPTGLKVGVVPCGATVRGCVRPVEAVQNAAEELGWNVTSYDGKSTPSGQNAAVLQAVAAGSDVIVTGGVDPAQIASGLKTAHEEDVLIASVTGYVPKSDDGFAFDIVSDFSEQGRVAGSWIIADSDGKAVMQPMRAKEFASADTFVMSAVAEVEKCAECEVRTPENFVATELSGDLGPRVVDIVRQNPDVDYLDLAYDPAATVVVPALQNAGLGEAVKIVSTNGDEQNLEYIRKGEVQAADLGTDFEYEGWMAVYQASRLLTGMPLWVTPGASNEIVENSGNVPFILYTENNVPESSGDYSADATINYTQKFREILGIEG